jgi:hypothetical protein
MEYHFFQGVVLETGDGQVQQGPVWLGRFHLGNLYLASLWIGRYDSPDRKMALPIAKFQYVSLGGPAHLYGVGAFVFV